MSDRELLQQALEALEQSLPIIQSDADMMATISRHAPLDTASQAAHDSYEYESERLVRELPNLITALRARLAEKPAPQAWQWIYPDGATSPLYMGKGPDADIIERAAQDGRRVQYWAPVAVDGLPSRSPEPAPYEVEQADAYRSPPDCPHGDAVVTDCEICMQAADEAARFNGLPSRSQEDSNG